MYSVAAAVSPREGLRASVGHGGAKILYLTLMSVKTLHDLPNELYFCTFTCCNWLPLFEVTNSYDEVYNWFQLAHEKKFRTRAYVIMPYHVHFIMITTYKNSNLNTLMSNGKRFIAYEIVERLKNSNRMHCYIYWLIK